MAEDKKMRLVINIDGKDYEMAGVPGPNSVGTAELRNDAVELEDLSPELRTIIDQGGGSAEVIVPVEQPVEAITTEAGKYYRFDQPVDTLAVTLPATVSNTKMESVGLFFTAGEHPNVTMAAADGKPVFYNSEYTVEPNKTYELSCKFNGARWIVTMMMLVGWFLFVEPHERQCISMTNPVTYNVSSNVKWNVE